MTETDSLKATEAECAATATAPRITLEAITEAIDSKFIFTAGSAAKMLFGIEDPALDLLTICLLKMKNGYIVVGKSAPAAAANFNPELGTKLAYEDAIRQVWPLMGWELRCKLANEPF